MNHPNVIPGLRYADAPAAIDWLREAFGFETRFVVPGPEGTIAHAQLQYGTGMIMLGSARDDHFDVQTPKQLGGNSQAIYVVVDDLDAHHARAAAAGARIVRAPADTEYGSRDYEARDLEGHVWTFGTYDPYAVP